MSRDVSADLHNQVEINRRLNDLLNSKDEEIGHLTSEVLELQENAMSLSPGKKKGILGSPDQSKNLIKGYGAVTSLENKLFEAHQQNKELQKEVKVLQLIQNRQGKSLEVMN